jgi:hypothetical protein
MPLKSTRIARKHIRECTQWHGRAGARISILVGPQLKCFTGVLVANDRFAAGVSGRFESATDISSLRVQLWRHCC